MVITYSNRQMHPQDGSKVSSTFQPNKCLENTTATYFNCSHIQQEICT